MRVLESTFVAALALLALHGQQALGCSHVRVSIPGADVIGRTMEVGGDGGEAAGLLSRRLVGAEGFTWMVNVHPRNRSMGFPAPCGRGITWKNALGFVSVDVAIELGGANLSVTAEGMNEKGLTVSGHTLRQSQYQDHVDGVDSVCFLDFVPWVLGNFDSVAAVRSALGGKRIAGPLPVLPIPSGDFLHWSVDDAEGGHIVIEVLSGSVFVHNNTVGVMSNDPDYTWHLRNLNNFVNLSPRWPDRNAAATVGSEIGSVPQAVGHGANLLGMPADYSPPSRFVRLFYLRQYAMLNARPANLNASIALTAGLLNNVFINKGTVATPGDESTYEFTQYSVMKIPQSATLLFKGYKSIQWKKIDLSLLDMTVAAALILEDGTLGIMDVTDQLARHRL